MGYARCAICGATVAGCVIGKDSRTKRRAAEGKTSQPSDDSECDDENEYDPYGLGLNPDVPGMSKAFVSGPASGVEYNTVYIESSDDPNFPKESDFQCYINEGDDDSIIVFPFHWPCYELFVKCSFRTSLEAGFSKLDKDRLYNVMSELCQDFQFHLYLDHGNPAPDVKETYWQSTPGEEVLVVSPSSTSFLQNTIKAIFESSDFKLPYSGQDLGLRVRNDRFSKLPYDLIHKIACLLPPKSLLDLSKASWNVNSAFRNVNSFWNGRIRRDMPWFFELQQALDNPDAVRGKNLKGIFMWTDKICTPKLWMSGPFMGLANRRRIWQPCQQLRDGYLRWEKISMEPKLEPSLVGPIPAVSSPASQRKIETIARWVHSLEDIYTQANFLEIFWSSDGLLVGMSVAPKNERRLLGQDDETTGVSKELVEIERGVWITGLVLHIPTIQDLLESQNNTRGNINTSVKGLTVIYNSGLRSDFGATNQGQSKRLLLAAKEHYVAGLTGEISKSEDVKRIVQLGLLQAKRPLPDDQSSIDDGEVELPRPNGLETYLWKDDCSGHLNMPIWEHPTIKVVTSGDTLNLEADIHKDLFPYEALI